MPIYEHVDKNYPVISKINPNSSVHYSINFTLIKTNISQTLRIE